MSNTVDTPQSQKDRRKRALFAQYIAFLVAVVVLAFMGGGVAGFLNGYIERNADAPDWMRVLRAAITSPWLYAAIMAGAMVWVTFWGLAYWRQLDELARAAHERAWFWGGSIAMGLGLGGVLIAAVVPPFCNMTIPGLTPMELIASGAVGITCLMLVGYGIAWGIFWWRAR